MCNTEPIRNKMDHFDHEIEKKSAIIHAGKASSFSISAQGCVTVERLTTKGNTDHIFKSG